MAIFVKPLFLNRKPAARLYTSYYSGYKGEFGVSITVAKPSWFTGKHYSPLAPSAQILQEVKSNKISEEEYSTKYIALLKSRIEVGILSHSRLLVDLSEGSVLLCYEGKGKFCHRHLAADWIRSGGIQIEEL